MFVYAMTVGPVATNCYLLGTSAPAPAPSSTPAPTAKRSLR